MYFLWAFPRFSGTMCPAEGGGNNAEHHRGTILW